MPLTISGATVGYDAEGISTLLDRVRADVINASKEELRKNLANLETSVDAIWQGHSEEVFKENMAEDVDRICSSLDTLYANLASEISQIGVRMAEIDNNLVKEK
jgi:uncharacterized protein YukE